jgi:methyltransferase (TIGR00027 family)
MGIVAPPFMNESSDLPQGVGSTAVGMAYLRMVETARPDHLFADPIAAEFVAASGWSPERGVFETAEDHSDVASAYMIAVALSAIVRTRFLDDFAIEASREGCRQLAFLGAGLDTRAFRLPWPETVRLFELDVADVIVFKERVLASIDAHPACERHVVVSDLRTDWAADLQSAGFDPSTPTAWIAEGLLIYLTSEENERLLQQLSALSVPGSRLGLSLSGPGSLAVPADIKEAADGGDDALGSLGSVTAMWQSEAPGDPAAWLAAHGWKADVFDVKERAVAYGRPLPERTPDAAARSFVRAVRAS